MQQFVGFESIWVICFDHGIDSTGDGIGQGETGLVKKGEDEGFKGMEERWEKRRGGNDERRSREKRQGRK